MINRNRFSLFLATFLIVGFFFLALPENGYSGLGPLGCCIDDGLNCIGCGLQEDSLDCAITQNNCPLGGTDFETGEVCLTIPGGDDRCDVDNSGLGCCVLSEDNCEEGQTIGACNGDGIAWFRGVECSEVPQCQVDVASAVPTLSEWGLIAMAGILGIVGFMVIRRRKVPA